MDLISDDELHDKFYEFSSADIDRLQFKFYV